MYRKQEKSLIRGSQLRRARKILKLTPEEVAQELNISSRDISSWEENISTPTLKQLEHLAELYSRDIDYFLRETPYPPEKIEFRGPGEKNLSNLSLKARKILAQFD